MELQNRLDACSDKAVKKKEKILAMIDRAIDSTEARALKLMKEYEEVGNKKPRYSFKFEQI